MNELECKEYLEILNELKQAFRNLNNAELKYIDIAVFQVKVAQCKIDAFINSKR